MKCLTTAGGYRSRWLNAGAGVLLACVATAAVSAAPAPPSALAAQRGDDPRGLSVPRFAPTRYGPGYGLGPQIGVDIVPRTEHWPSNFVPDTYQLKGYDGRPDSPRVCRGKSGLSIATNARRCPPGGHPPKGGRALSTGD